MEQYIISSNTAISDSGFLFLPTTGESFTLNQIGANIVKALKEGQDTESIINSVLKEYEVDRNQFEKDLTDFLNQLKNYNLLETL